MLSQLLHKTQWDWIGGEPAQTDNTIFDWSGGEPHIIYERIGGWTGKISGVINPAKVMGIAAANINKVKGVA